MKPEPYPSVEVLRRVNHRRFAFELGGGLPDQHYVEDRRALEAILARGGAWQLKRPLSFAGRGQLRVFRELSLKEWAWIDASLNDDGLIVEPLVTPTLEVSQHGFVWRRRQVRDWTAVRAGGERARGVSGRAAGGDRES